MASTIITKSDEVAERSLRIDHGIPEGHRLLIGQKDELGVLKVLLEIEVGVGNTVYIKGEIIDQKNPV